MEGSREAGGNEGDARAPHDPREVASVFLIDSMQRRWLPSLMQESNDWDNDVPRAASARNTSQGYTSPIDPGTRMQLCAHPASSHPRDPAVRTRLLRLKRQWKIFYLGHQRSQTSGSTRYTPGGAPTQVESCNVTMFHRGFIATRTMFKNPVQLAGGHGQRLENDRKNHRRLVRHRFTGCPSLKPQVVCMTEEDPRLIRREPTPEREEDVHLPRGWWKKRRCLTRPLAL
ncbi:hypothetical protein ERJ75_000119400 [Trypanosoma vivax]|nr:hypothetical protein ERJ75_000119400 [Trypanosoma vivax]